MKDSVTGNEIINYDFFNIKPPVRIKEDDAGKETVKLFRELNKLLYSKKSYSKNDNSNLHVSNYKHNLRLQPCMVKMYYGNDKNKHVNFLRNYMPQENKKEINDKPILFNASKNEMTEDDIKSYEENADDLYFKFIISPESQLVPMKEMVRQYVSNLEKITGYEFSWCAVTHSNTNNIHSHLLINGVDKRTGEKIKFKPNVIKEICRKIGGHICTSLVGERTQEQIQASISKMPKAKRWTKLDENIKKEKGYYIFDELKNINKIDYGAKKIANNEVDRRRLDNLCNLGLALKYDKNIPAVYYLENNWEDKLKSIGRYNTFLEARQKLVYTDINNLQQYTYQDGKIEGEITQRYFMDDETIWNNAIVVENKKLNKSWYIPLRIKPDEETLRLKNGEKVLGSKVVIELKENQKGKLHPNINIIKTGRNEKSR